MTVLGMSYMAYWQGKNLLVIITLTSFSGRGVKTARSFLLFVNVAIPCEKRPLFFLDKSKIEAEPLRPG